MASKRPQNHHGFAWIVLVSSRTVAIVRIGVPKNGWFKLSTWGSNSLPENPRSTKQKTFFVKLT